MRMRHPNTKVSISVSETNANCKSSSHLLQCISAAATADPSPTTSVLLTAPWPCGAGPD